jgi:hypothetical protein
VGSYRQDVQATVRPRSRSDLIAAGVSRRTLAGSSWRQVSRGSHVPASAPGTPAQRVVEACATVPDGCVSGWAAAYVLGAEMFDGRDALTGRRQDVRVVLPLAASRVAAPGLRCVRTERLASDEVVVRHGVRVTSPVRTAIDLAREAPDLVEAVVALDGLLRARVLRPGQLNRVAVVTALRGAAQARAAASLARPGLRSPWETRLRLFVVCDLGLPEPLVNTPVFALEGTFLGAPDLLDPEAGLTLEFDGAGHRERSQHRSDNVHEGRALSRRARSSGRANRRRGRPRSRSGGGRRGARRR